MIPEQAKAQREREGIAAEVAYTHPHLYDHYQQEVQTSWLPSFWMWLLRPGNEAGQKAYAQGKESFLKKEKA